MLEHVPETTSGSTDVCPWCAAPAGTAVHHCASRKTDSPPIRHPEEPHTCPKCGGNGTSTGRHRLLHPTDLLCPVCLGAGIVWRG